MKARRRILSSLAVLILGAAATAQDAFRDGLPTIYIAGDSTAAEGTAEARGWGRHLAQFFNPERVRVENRARGGRSSRTFVTEGLWERIHAQLKPGDVVLLQFSHNDGGSINDPQRARGSLRGIGEETEAIDNQQTGQREIVHAFGWYLRKMIAETRERGAQPVVLSLTVRNIWKDAHVERGSGNYSAWSREVATAQDVMFIDVTNFAADAYEQLGQAAVAKLFPADQVHNNDAGALLNAQLVTQLFNGLREEAWSHWLSPKGRALARAEPRFVRIASVRTAQDGNARFLNTPQRADNTLPSIWLVGDSTVRTGRGRGEQGQYGWGDPLQNLFDLNKVNVVNRALGGTGARTFRAGGYWQPVLEQLQPGDVVLIQFGHNDNGERGALPGVGTQTAQQGREGAVETVATFGEYLRQFIAEIRSKQATPVLCSPIPRKTWVDGRIVRSDDSHAAWAKQVAASERVLFIDLYERIAKKYDALGQAAVDPMFADAGVHTSYAGAVLNAATVSEGLRDLSPDPVQKFLLAAAAGTAAESPLFNPLPVPLQSNLGLVLEKFLTLPESAPTSGAVSDRRLVRRNRINDLSELPDGSGRLAVPDLNGPLYLLKDGRYSQYLNLNEHFPHIHNHAGLGTGFGFVAFHPEFGRNGIFYTVHTESGVALREKKSDFAEFGNAVTQSVITKWVAKDPRANRFAGSSTEMMRIAFGGQIHTVQQIGFNPTAKVNDADYGLLYLLVGDGGNGMGNGNPQDLSTPHGAILRIDPMGRDGRTGQYSIPRDNPFRGVPGALPEIYAYGLRDPHRMSWDPAAGQRMFVGNIGEWQVESIYEVRPGDNFGWSKREGPFRADSRQLYPLPGDDARLGYTYPVAAYDHERKAGQTGDAGVAVAGGYVYRGRIEQLNGRYIFSDFVRGLVFATRADQMQRGRGLAPIEQLRLYVDGKETTFAELNADARVDLRVGRDAKGELYLLSKGSGTIWRVAAARVEPSHDNTKVIPELANRLVAYYDFDHPIAANAGFESDRGLSGTPIELINGGAAMRVAGDPAYPGASNALQTRGVDGSNNDWKAGLYAASGVRSLTALSATKAISVAGWFKQTGLNPGPGANAIGLAGLLSGSSDGHLVRALLEIYKVDGKLRLVALGRRLDDGRSAVFAANAPWEELLPPNQWVHLAASFDFDRGEMHLYANGKELEGTYTASEEPRTAADIGPRFTSPSDPRGIKIGGSFPQNSAESNPCNCRMDDLMFLDGVLTPQQIARQYARFVSKD